MQMNLDRVLTTMEGRPVSDSDGRLTGRRIAVMALVGPEEEKTGAEEKLRRWTLAQRIQSDPDVDLSAEDVALIKALVGKGFTALIVGQMFDLLEGKPAAIPLRDGGAQSVLLPPN